MLEFEINNDSVAKIELGLSPEVGIDERPPTLDFSLYSADMEDWEHVIRRSGEERRQTMNLRSSKTAQLIVVRDDETYTIRGWAGLDLSRVPEYPELFSSYLEPGYRHYLLWLAMTHARCQQALAAGKEFLFFRIAEKFADQITKGQSKTELYDALIPESLDPAFRSLCRGCEFYDNTCTRQAFLSMDNAKMLQHIQVRIGSLPPTFPMRFTLDKEKMRSPQRDQKKMQMEWKKN